METGSAGSGRCARRTDCLSSQEQPRLVVDAHNGSQPGVAVEIICPRSQNRGYRCLSRLAAVMASSSQSDGAQQADAGNFSPLGRPVQLLALPCGKEGRGGFFLKSGRNVASINHWALPKRSDNLDPPVWL